MKRFSDGLFKNRVRKPRNPRGKAGSKADCVLDATELEDFELPLSDPLVPDDSSGDLHLPREDMRWSVAPDRNLIEEDDDDIRMSVRPDDMYMSVRLEDMYTSVREGVLKVEDTIPSTPNTPETPSQKKKKLKKRIKERTFGSQLGKKKKKKKRLSDESSNGKKKGKKNKSKDPESKEKSTEIGDIAESNEAPQVKDIPRRPAPPTKFIRSSFFKSSLLNIFTQEPSKPQDSQASPGEPKKFDGSLTHPNLRSEQSEFSSAFKTIVEEDEENEDSTLAESRQEQQAIIKKPTEYKLKDAVNKVRSFAFFRDQISNHRTFKAAFDDDKEGNEDEIVTKKREQQKEHFNKLVNDLQECEAMLQKERAEMSILKANIRLEQNSTEELLLQESLRNEELQAEILALREELDQAGEAAQLDELREENRMLKTENELLQQKTERQQDTIASMMGAEKSTSICRNEFRPSTRIATLVLSEEGSMDFTNIKIDDDDKGEWSRESGFRSMSSLSGKARGELLQLRSTLKSKDKTLEEQGRELAEVKQELDQLKEEQGVDNLTSHVENLENEKKFFVCEIERLQKELEKAVASAPTTSNQEDTKMEGSGWFDFGARKTLGKVEEDEEFQDVVNDLNGTNMAPIESASKLEAALPERSMRLSTLMNF